MTVFEAVTLGGKILLIVNFLLLFSIHLINYIKYKKHMSRSMFLLLLLLLGTIYIELASEYLYNRSIPNLHLTHFYTLGQFLLISVIYYKLLDKFKLAIPIGVILFSSVLIYQLLDSKIIYDEFNTSGFLVSACILIGYAFLYFIEHISQKKYWDSFNVGLFLYLGGSSIIFFTLSSLRDLNDWHMLLWTINGVLIIFYQAFISITIYRYYRGVKNQNGISSL